jgi:hypothetical protein
LQGAVLHLELWRLSGNLLEWGSGKFQLTLRVLLRRDDQKGFRLLPRS